VTQACTVLGGREEPCLEDIVDGDRDLGSGILSIKALGQQLVVGTVCVSDMSPHGQIDCRLFELPCNC